MSKMSQHKFEIWIHHRMDSKATVLTYGVESQMR